MRKLEFVLFVCMSLAIASYPALGSAPPCLSQPNDATDVAAAQTAAEKACDCAGVVNHFSYVQCVRGVARDAFTKGDIRKTCLKNVVNPLSKSSCGIPGSATCCSTTSLGASICRVIPEIACKPRSGETAAPGSKPWCFVACEG